MESSALRGCTPKMCDRWHCGSRSIASGRCFRCAAAATRFNAVVVLPTPPFWLKTAMIATSDEVPANLCNDNFSHDDDRRDRNENECDPIPLEEVQRRIEHHADAAGADEAQHGRFA